MNDAKKYSVTITNSFGCTDSTSVTTIKNPNPTPVISGNLSFCSGSSTILNAGTYSSYLWSTLATTKTISANTAGTFSVKVTDSQGCTGTSSVITSIKSYSIGPINGPDGVCLKQSGVIYCVANPSPGIISYIWTLPVGVSAIGAADCSCITLKFSSKFKGGSICVKAVTPCGNTSSSCKNVILISKAPNTPGTISGPTSLCPNTIGTYSIATVPGAASYLWSYSGNMQILSGQGTLSITIKALSSFNNGSVKVKAVNCKDVSGIKSLNVSKSTRCRISNLTSFESSADSEILSGLNVFPNPSSGKITVNFISKSKSKYILHLMDLLGKKVLINPVEAAEGKNEMDLELSHLAKGMYFLSLEKEGVEVKSLRIVVD